MLTMLDHICQDGNTMQFGEDGVHLAHALLPLCSMQSRVVGFQPSCVKIYVETYGPKLLNGVN